MLGWYFEASKAEPGRQAITGILGHMVEELTPKLSLCPGS